MNNEVFLKGQVTKRGALSTPPGARTEYCEIGLEVDGCTFQVCGNGEMAIWLSGLLPGCEVDIHGKMVIVKWDTAQGPRERIVVEVL